MRSGFTFLEILVSTVILVLLLGAVHGLFAGGTRQQRQSAERLARNRRLERVRDLLEKDLRGALLTGGTLAATLQGGPEGVDSRYPGFLTLTTTSARRDPTAPGADVQRVEYTVEAAATNAAGGVLHRTVRRILLAPAEDAQVGPALLEGVAALDTAFYDGTQWTPSWDAETAGGATPAAVRVRVEWADAGGRAGSAPPPLEVVVPWALQPFGTNAAPAVSSASATAQAGGGAT